MQNFTLRLKPDNGYVSIHTIATDENAARRIVCAAERCSERAIRRVYHGKKL